ncbi:hypothetical protein ATN88_00025 [Enterovibrio coralii]|uniref:Uncharacterized protein n=1 Tax=Enterovibrio coralii TaxID=294935 RepID=A0A135I6W7_9GAMM|nr:hypothetical protein ATN88_00025 [Enterovibrio coralii]
MGEQAQRLQSFIEEQAAQGGAETIWAGRSSGGLVTLDASPFLFDALILRTRVYGQSSSVPQAHGVLTRQLYQHNVVMLNPNEDDVLNGEIALIVVPGRDTWLNLTLSPSVNQYVTEIEGVSF